MKKMVIWMFTAAVLGVLFVVLCTFVRRPYEHVLLYRFGTLIDQDQQARIMYQWYIKWPTDTVVPIDTRLHLYTGPLEEIATAKKDPISIRAYAAWRIVDPAKFYRTTGGSDVKARDTFIDPKIRAIVKRKIVAHSLDELFNTDQAHLKSGEIEKEVADEATNGGADPESPTGRTSGLADQGIEVVQVGFSRMAFAPQNADAVYARMESELIKTGRDYYAQGLAQAAEIRSEGDTAAATRVAEAKATAEKTRGEGDSEALAILAAVQKSPAAREFYQYWKSLDFAKNSFAQNTILVLPTTSDWLKALFQTPGAATRPVEGGR